MADYNSEKLNPKKDNFDSRLAAARDPGAIPKKNLKQDNIAALNSNDLDTEPNSEVYEAYEDSHQRINHPDEPHKNIP